MAAAAFELVVDAREVWSRLGLNQDQVPYAMSLAVNSCAFAARKSLHARLPEIFHIRTKFVPSGLHVNTSTKTSLQAALGFLDSRWFMVSQTTGEQNREKPGGKPIWQPLQTGSRSPRPSISERIIPSRRPHTAVDPVKLAQPTEAGNKRRSRGRNEAGYIKLTGPNMKWPGIYYREEGDKRKLIAAYWLQESQDIKPRLDLQGEVDKSLAENWPKAAVDAVERALKPRGAKQKPWVWS
jgi:hypothetical protein